jgi:hypothetical protein
MPAPARYVPLAHTLHAPGKLARPHVDQFGNGAADVLRLQVDSERDAYLAQKAAVLRGALAPPAGEPGFDPRPALAWLRRTLAAEHPGLLDGAALGSLDQAVGALQEDLVVMRRARPDGAPRAAYLHVSLPSGWRPERMAGASFEALHAPVPKALLGKRPIASYGSRLFDDERVRFVWTLTPDPGLDRHPERCQPDWAGTQRLFLRVERQLLVPLDALEALFLIRVYSYPVDTLAADERAELARRIAALDAETRRYKGWDGHEARLMALLAVTADAHRTDAHR